MKEIRTSRKEIPRQQEQKVHRTRITQKILDKYGRTDNCPACDKLGPSHSPECRLRIERAMVQSGEAHQFGGAEAEVTIAVPIAEADVGISTRKQSLTTELDGASQACQAGAVPASSTAAGS